MTKQETNPVHRTIKSFVRREGRMTATQKEAFEKCWPHYGLSLDDGVLHYDKVFQSSKRVILEIGFGMGQSLVEMARVDSEAAFVGIEVHRPGVGALFAAMEKQAVSNIRVYCHDAIEILKKTIPDASLDRLQLFFPDPWPKKRHHKRRIVQAEFLKLVVQKLKPGGIFHAATDWENYAEHMLEVLEACPDLHNQSTGGGYSVKPDYRPETKFERRGVALGHGVFDLVFYKVS